MLKIRYYRLVSGLSQEELAEKVNVSQPKISQLENGIVKVSQYVLDEIAVILEFPHPSRHLLDVCGKEEPWSPSS